MHKLLKKLGLDAQEQEVFIKLVLLGEATVLKVSRHTGINRTNVYRVLEDLERQGFVVKNPKSQTTKYSASSIEFLESKVRDKQADAKETSRIYDKMVPDLHKLYAESSSEIKVVHYTGGVQARQLVWNSLRAKKTVKSFGYKTLRDPLGDDYLVDFWNETLRRNIVTYMIANPETFVLKNTPRKEKTPAMPVPKELFKTRSLDKNELEIIYESFIYNDVYAVLQWDEKQIFGVEVYNKGVARQQELVFDFLWDQAKGYTYSE